MTTTVGVFALQGDVREHVAVLRGLGVRALGVRRASELDLCDALVLPGGESTTMAKLARTFDLFDPIRKRLDADMRKYFDKCEEKLGFVPNVLKAYSFDQVKLRAFVNMYNDLMLGDSRLSKLEREIMVTPTGRKPTLPRRSRPVRAETRS